MATNSNTKTNEPTAADLAKQKNDEAQAAASEKAKAVAEKGELKVAVNRIFQTGADGKPEEVAPGTTFYPAKVDLDFLVKHEAVRDPTETERVMHERLEALQSATTSTEDALG